MKDRWLKIVALIVAPVACSSVARYDPLEDYVELDSTTVLNAPSVSADSISPDIRDAVAQGEYMVELLGCGACHTDGAFVGAPDTDKPLAGSRIGIAYTNPLAYRLPGVVYPPNITPDPETGIGDWSDKQFAEAIRAGKRRHGARLSLVMPWGGYAFISDDDLYAITQYLRNIEPVHHRVPDDVPPGTPASERYVHFGVYEDR